MAEVFAAYDPDAELADQLLVIKRIRAHLGQDEHFIMMLLDEGRIALDDWSAAIDALLDLGAEEPRVVVLDELPYLVDAQAALPSLLQAAFAPRAEGRRRSRTRLILCGSALSFTETCLLLEAQGRSVAPIPLLETVVEQAPELSAPRVDLAAGNRVLAQARQLLP